MERFQAKHGEPDKIISELNSDRWLWKGMKSTNLQVRYNDSHSDRGFVNRGKPLKKKSGF